MTVPSCIVLSTLKFPLFLGSPAPGPHVEVHGGGEGEVLDTEVQQVVDQPSAACGLAVEGWMVVWRGGCGQEAQSLGSGMMETNLINDVD